jgi:thiamine pyrophosphokinase
MFKKVNTLLKNTKFRPYHHTFSTRYKMQEDTLSSQYIIDNTFLDDDPKSSEKDIFLSLLILNRPIQLAILRKFLPYTKLLVAADGGANRLYDCLPEDERVAFKPNYIVGDLDSIRSDVAEFYKSKGVIFEHVECQDNTDMQKALIRINEHLIYDFKDIPKKKENVKLFIMGALDGRLDQTLSNLSTFLKMSKVFANMGNYFLVNENSMATCLMPGKNEYRKSEKFEKIKGVGIVPLGEKVGSVKTVGFKWNLGILLIP